MSPMNESRHISTSHVTYEGVMSYIYHITAGTGKTLAYLMPGLLRCSRDTAKPLIGGAAAGIISMTAKEPF